MYMQIGDVVEGRCVSTNLLLRGNLAAVFLPQPGMGDSSCRYQITEVEYVDNPEWSRSVSAIIFA